MDVRDPRHPTRTPLLIVSAILWMVGAVAGFRVLLDYAAAPGFAAAPSGSWPGGTGLDRSRERPTLVLAIHPRCPCTRATLGELEKIVAHSLGRLDVKLLFVVPDGMSDEWAQSDLWRRGQEIPGVTAVLDRRGTATARLGASTSGHALVYAGDGRLLFSGGITSSRGHAGESDGATSILALAHGREPQIRETTVFGCPLGTPDACSTPDLADSSCCKTHQP